MKPVNQKKSVFSAHPPLATASGFSKAGLAARSARIAVVVSLLLSGFPLSANAETGGGGGVSPTPVKAPATSVVQSEKQKEAAARAAEAAAAAAAKKKQFNETMDAYQSSVDKLTAQYHELQGKYDHCRDDYASKLRFVQRCTALTMGMCAPFFLALRWYRSKHPCNQFSDGADQVYKALTELKGSRPDFDFASDFPSMADLDNTPIPEIPVEDTCPAGTTCTGVAGPTGPTGEGTGGAGHTLPNGPNPGAGGDGGNSIKPSAFGSRGYGAGGSAGGSGGGLGAGGGAGLGSGFGNSMTGNGADPAATTPLVGAAAAKGKDLSFGGGGGSIGGGGRGGGIGGDGGAGFDPNYGAGGAGGKRAPASVAGLSKKLKSGESIGVQGDNIFQMITRTYQEKTKQNSFNTSP